MIPDIPKNSELQAQNKVLLSPVGSLDGRIARRRAQDIQEIEENLEDLSRIFNDLQVVVEQQGEELKLAERSVEVSKVENEKAVENLGKCLEKAKHGRHLKLFAGGGAAAGAALGTVGFLVNPAVGVITLLACSGLGLGTGAALSYVK